VVVGSVFRGRWWTAEGAGVVRELRVSEMGYRGVLEVLDGAVISAGPALGGVAADGAHLVASVGP